jgi:hypothetical protein
VNCCDRHAFVRPPAAGDALDQLEEQRQRYHYIVAHVLPDIDTEHES